MLQRVGTNTYPSSCRVQGSNIEPETLTCPSSYQVENSQMVSSAATVLSNCEAEDDDNRHSITELYGESRGLHVESGRGLSSRQVLRRFAVAGRYSSNPKPPAATGRRLAERVCARPVGAVGASSGTRWGVTCDGNPEHQRSVAADRSRHPENVTVTSFTKCNVWFSHLGDLGDKPSNQMVGLKICPIELSHRLDVPDAIV